MWSVKRDLIKDIISSAVFISAVIYYMNFRYEDALRIYCTSDSVYLERDAGDDGARRTGGWKRSEASYETEWAEDVISMSLKTDTFLLL